MFLAQKMVQIYQFVILTLLLVEATIAKSGLPYRVEVEKQGRLILSWNYNDDHIAVDLQAKINPKSWIAFGFSDYGEFTHADFCVFWTDLWGREHLTDVFSDGKGVLHVDQTQNCQFVSVNQTTTRTQIRFIRKRRTCEEEDYQLEEGTTHTLYVLGPGPIATIEGQSVTNENEIYKNMLRLSLFPPKLPDEETQPSVDESKVKVMDVLSEKVQVPAKETTYWCVIKKLPSLFQKNHIIRYESNIQEGNEDLVHHIEVFHCEAPPGQQLFEWEGDCDADTAPQEIEHCKRVIGAWAMGEFLLRQICYHYLYLQRWITHMASENV
ncbi:hypothetical protein RvY_07495-2 [Ramazzottius varieornatus]|uniref:DOMON domain-containing protein n=1 Tax=Ramazzottius varieornatus TaxID=947166 RepID=A0A1D1V2E2_RAMVA|nr:hypothetical protein RvY_07495-2 [Ramazzottius varieornatus]